jgi:hypothetical protein
VAARIIARHLGGDTSGLMLHCLILFREACGVTCFLGTKPFRKDIDDVVGFGAEAWGPKLAITKSCSKAGGGLGSSKAAGGRAGTICATIGFNRTHQPSRYSGGASTKKFDVRADRKVFASNFFH